MRKSADNPTPSLLDRARIASAGVRYDFWLDVCSVPRTQRRALRAELKTNLDDAGGRVGVGRALSSVGSLRCLASRSARQGRLSARWAAGAVTAAATVVGLLAIFVIATLYWGEGVLDAGGTETVQSSLFPFFGSRVGISPADDGVAWSMNTGPLPFVSAFAIWLIVTRPWRSLRLRSATTERGSASMPAGSGTNATSTHPTQADSQTGGVIRRATPSSKWSGVGIALGGGVGLMVGLLTSGGVGIALGLTFGAGVGLTVGAALDSRAAPPFHRRVAPPEGSSWRRLRRS